MSDHRPTRFSTILYCFFVKLYKILLSSLQLTVINSELILIYKSQLLLRLASNSFCYIAIDLLTAFINNIKLFFEAIYLAILPLCILFLLIILSSRPLFLLLTMHNISFMNYLSFFNLK